MLTTYYSNEYTKSRFCLHDLKNEIKMEPHWKHDEIIKCKIWAQVLPSCQLPRTIYKVAHQH
jgi:hypothetical protein